MCKKKKGLTLVEVCVGIVVLSIAITTIIHVLYLSSLLATTVRDKTIILNCLQHDAESTLTLVRAGIPPARAPGMAGTSLTTDPLWSRDYFGPNWSVSYYQPQDLGNGLYQFKFSADLRKVRPRASGEISVYTMQIPLLTTSFALEEETRMTGEREPIIRFR